MNYAPILEPTDQAALTGSPFPAHMMLTPLSRNPIRLEGATMAAVLNRQTPAYSLRRDPSAPLASIIVVTFNNLVFTRMCLESLLANTDYPNYEILVVDNHSTDGTPDYLRRLATKHRQLRLFFNDTNVGFPTANNQALQQASGDVLVLLNNDTMVFGGWLTGLVRHLRDGNVGLVGPITNRLGNEAEIETSYRTYGEFVEFAATVANRPHAEVFDIRIGSMFCLAMRRDTFERLGPIDEQFGLGMFEDDDYSVRARAAGLRVVCTDDVFVHHFGGASFGELAASGEFGRMFHANRGRWEAKWGRPWESPSRRPNPAYQKLREVIRWAVCETTPPAATVAVVSKGDEDLLKLLRDSGRQAWHFSRTANGGYAGYHPPDGRAAIAELEQLRREGAEFLLLPQSSGWWLEHYRDFMEHLDRRYAQVVRRPEICWIYSLSEGEPVDV